jgi:hypothetical protein
LEVLSLSARASSPVIWAARVDLLKRAQLLAWDDAKGRNLVIAGSPISIRSLREHPILEAFFLKDRTEAPRVGVGATLNKEARPGEESVFFGPGKRPDQFDYAVIARVPGVNRARRVCIPAKPITDSNLMAIRIPRHADHCRSEATPGLFHDADLIGMSQSILV